MFYLNLRKIEVGHFPDNTTNILDFPVSAIDEKINEIYWQYENDAEIFSLFLIVKHINTIAPQSAVVLTSWYFPHSRMDRVKNNKEVFTLKYFCQIVNSLNFKRVRILDPHSDVTPALLERVEILSIDHLIEYSINAASEDCNDEDFYVFFPDAGAMKRYKDFKAFKGINLIYGQKQRDWETGEIQGLEIMDKNGHVLSPQLGIDFETAGLNGNPAEAFIVEFRPFEGKTILMVDDIISYGGTLYHSALKLKELGAKEIYAYASHTENSVLDREKGTFRKCLDDGTVKKLFTTSSIFHGKHDSIDIIG